jgi:effector-binding domain-containing protein
LVGWAVCTVMGTYLQSEPKVEERAEQPYVGIRGAVSMSEIAKIADRLGDVFEWLAANGVEPAGAPFFKYDVIDMDRLLRMEVGVPISEARPGEGDVVAGVLPAGRYATVTHTGHPDDLVHVTGELLAWADEHGHEWDKKDGPDGEEWRCRLEIYYTDPAEEPDMSKWTTELAFKLAGG